MNNLTIVHTPQIKIPKEMLYIDKKGKRTIINTLTKTGAITKKNKKSVISITANDGAFEIVDKGKTANNMSIAKVKNQPKVFDEQPTQITSIIPQVVDTRKRIAVSIIPDLSTEKNDLLKYEKEFNDLNIQKNNNKNTPLYNQIMDRRLKVFNRLIILEEKLRKNKERKLGTNHSEYVSKYTL